QLKFALERRGHQVDLLGTGHDEDNSFVYIVNENRRVYKNKLMLLLEEKLVSAAYPSSYENYRVLYDEYQRYIFELSLSFLGLAKYDLIHAQDLISATCLLRARSDKTALVASLHDSFAHDNRYQLQTINKVESVHLSHSFDIEWGQIEVSDAEKFHVPNRWLQ